MGAYRTMKISLNLFLMDFAKNYLVTGHGNSLPGSGEKGQFFYKTDTQKLYLYDTSWTIVNDDEVLLDFDAHAQIKYPAHDFIGLRGFTLEQNQNTYRVAALIGLGIFSDQALNRHDQVMDMLMESLQPLRSIPLFDMNTGAPLNRSLVVIDGVQALPMAKADERPIQFVSVDFESQLTASIK